MKRILCISVLFVLTLGLFYACSDDEKKDAKEYTLTVASVKPLVVFSEYCEAGYPSYYVKYEGEDDWKTYQSIRDFTHEEGYEYVIRVRDEIDQHYWDIINGGGVVCGGYQTGRIVKLLEIISKESKESQNIPVESKAVKIASKGTKDQEYPYFYYGACWIGEWQKFPQIENFEYEEGYEYFIEIACKYNGSNANPKYTYTYIKTHEKEKKDSDRLPE